MLRVRGRYPSGLNIRARFECQPIFASCDALDFDGEIWDLRLLVDPLYCNPDSSLCPLIEEGSPSVPWLWMLCYRGSEQRKVA